VSGPNRSNIIDYVTINSASNATSFGVLSLTREYLSGTSNGVNDRGVFAGGSTTIYENVIDYITISSTGNATNFGDLTLGRYNLSAVSNRTNDRGVFAGGNRGGSIYQNEIDYITISSTSNATDFGDLTEATGAMRSSVSNGTYDRGVFGGGRRAGQSYINIIEYITISSTSNATDFGDLTIARIYAGGCSDA